MNELVLWRISNFRDLSGTGGTRTSGRWHIKGRPVVYLADNPSTSLLEVLVHFEMTVDELPDALTLLRVTIPDKSSTSDIQSELSNQWPSNIAETRQLGDAWLKSGSSLLLRVPSVIVPFSFNYLFNPLHSDAENASFSIHQLPLDPRLVR